MISIDDAKRLAKRHRLKRCVILFQLEDGRVGYASYGHNRAFCKSTAEIMDHVFDDIERRMVLDMHRLEA